MKKHHKIGIVAGSVVFFVNMGENILHYSIGKNNGNGNDSFKVYLPTAKELLQMTGTSIVAGLIVGFATKHISK